jgi:hypothetical protein
MMNLRHGSKLRSNHEPSKDRHDTYDLAGEPKRFDDALPVKFQEHHHGKAIECDIGIGGKSPLLPATPLDMRVRIRRFGWINLFPTNNLGSPSEWKQETGNGICIAGLFATLQVQ